MVGRSGGKEGILFQLECVIGRGGQRRPSKDKRRRRHRGR